MQDIWGLPLFDRYFHATRVFLNGSYLANFSHLFFPWIGSQRLLAMPVTKSPACVLCITIHNRR
jgi:hypothetical protein